MVGTKKRNSPADLSILKLLEKSKCFCALRIMVVREKKAPMTKEQMKMMRIIKGLYEDKDFST